MPDATIHIGKRTLPREIGTYKEDQSNNHQCDLYHFALVIDGNNKRSTIIVSQYPDLCKKEAEVIAYIMSTNNITTYQISNGTFLDFEKNRPAPCEPVSSRGERIFKDTLDEKLK